MGGRVRRRLWVGVRGGGRAGEGLVFEQGRVWVTREREKGNEDEMKGNGISKLMMNDKEMIMVSSL